jgi:hypothetical protein
LAVTLREERFEGDILAEEAVRKMRLKKKHNEEFLDLYPSKNILEVTKSRKMK